MGFLSLQAYHEIFPYSRLNEVTDFRVFLQAIYIFLFASVHAVSEFRTIL
jgi:hypothetical protein